ncbi:MAG: non-homologous end-joining DNA ligase [Streptosporangiaceae bacterium]
MLPSWVEPELATLTSARFWSRDWMYERKLDGERCLAFVEGATVRLLTRNKKPVTSTYPELADALRDMHADSFIADGEVVAFDRGRTSFARLQQRMQVLEPSAELIGQVPVSYYLFDLLHAEGEDLRGLPLRARKRSMRQMLRPVGPLRLTPYRTGASEDYLDQACRWGWEGLIAKRADAPYRSGRSRDWLKFKCVNSQEVVIGGYTDPRGGREGFGALLIGYYDASGRLVYAGKVGTGFSEVTLRRLHDQLRRLERRQPPFDRGELPRSGVHWVEPKLVAQVGFTEWTTAGQLRHPRFLGLRDDKAPRDVVREKPAPARAS